MHASGGLAAPACVPTLQSGAASVRTARDRVHLPSGSAADLGQTPPSPGLGHLGSDRGGFTGPAAAPLAPSGGKALGQTPQPQALGRTCGDSWGSRVGGASEVAPRVRVSNPGRQGVA